jgi:hypothetical protein
VHAAKNAILQRCVLVDPIYEKQNDMRATVLDELPNIVRQVPWYITKEHSFGFGADGDSLRVMVILEIKQQLQRLALG